ncbi:hypothetical protein GUJ93_ZPchr0012g22028 [Zizania palustris]|uniref:Uncharacterized protein n=1 Tax=Zizania palustris TaxID=103762 RepID=A0A8J5WLB7_ZIZPA|nr:hypothetical protein GUJ93_ZPchr0012g22028 [Zizania palustris]
MRHALASWRLPEGMAETGERVPDAVAPGVMPVLRAADEAKPTNPRVAFLLSATESYPVSYPVYRDFAAIPFFVAFFLVVRFHLDRFNSSSSG